MKLNKKTLVTAITFLLIGIIGTSIIWIYASPSGSFYISGGVYPNASTYTIWKEGTTYYAKDAYGKIPSWGETSNFSSLMISVLQDLKYWGGSISIQKGNYFADTQINIPYDENILSYINIYGVGEKTNITFTGTGYLFNITQYQNQISNMGISVSSSATGIILLHDAYFTTLKELTINGIKDVTQYGIRFYGSLYSQIFNVRMYNMIVGISLDENPSSGFKSNANNFFGGRIALVKRAINITKGNSNNFYGTNIESIDPDFGDENEAISIYEGMDNTFFGAYIENFSNSSGIELLYTALRTAIINCYIEVQSPGKLIIDGGRWTFIVNSRTKTIQIPRTNDPDTSDWGANERGRMWFSLDTNTTKYWNGTDIVEFP